MENVRGLIQEIKENVTQVSASQKDEVLVMRAMLNDRDYEVGVYGKEGQIGTFSPAKEAREMIGSVISGAVSMKQAEAQELANAYDFKKSEAANMVNISKEYINTYLQTGRKLPLGGRETMDAALSLKTVEPSVKRYPKKVGVDENGKNKYDFKEVNVNAHQSIKAHGSCPAWCK